MHSPSTGTTPPFAPEATDARRASWLRWALVCLLISAAVIRFAGVYDMSFYGDEETTAFAARSALDSGSPSMPSGMSYNRAPLYSYMAAASASLLGEQIAS